MNHTVFDIQVSYFTTAYLWRFQKCFNSQELLKKSICRLLGVYVTPLKQQIFSITFRGAPENEQIQNFGPHFIDYFIGDSTVFISL